MRRVVATTVLVTCAVLATGCGLLQADTEPRAELGPLQPVKAEGFRIGLPCDPTESVQIETVAGNELATTIWMCDAGESAYTVSRTPVPRGVPIDLDGAVQGAADGVGGQVASASSIRYSGARGRDIRIETTYERQSATVFQRMLVHEGALIQVQAVLLEEDAQVAPDRYDRMLESLVLR
ncbi:hypothetical protein [Nocardioides lacusdianchii]|uniref:hypothetical protein n=1 Tax=Nocardioides lacusdianchii TaxID=2783664 RepID=UPI001CC8FD7B|nr:hypothetical protein [Nocardioides lacusdianchii]